MYVIFIYIYINEGEDPLLNNRTDVAARAPLLVRTFLARDVLSKSFQSSVPSGVV